MTFKDHFIYWILPTSVVTLCIAGYYFDFLGLAKIIAPEFNRELGLLENIQVVLILGMVFLAIRALKKSRSKIERVFFWIVIVMSTFVFLEEIDYGLHIPDYLAGRSHKDVVEDSWTQEEIRNLHNQSDLLPKIKFMVYTSMILVILILPLVTSKFKAKTALLLWLTPTYFLIITMIAMAVLNQIAHYLEKNIENQRDALNSNVAEFEEVFIYYIAFLYVWEISRKSFVSMRTKKVA